MPGYARQFNVKETIVPSVNGKAPCRGYVYAMETRTRRESAPGVKGKAPCRVSPMEMRGQFELREKWEANEWQIAGRS